MGKPAATVETETAVLEEEVPAGAFVPVQEEALQRVWHEIKHLKKSENMLEYSLLNCPYQLREQNEIVLMVSNMVLMEQFNTFRPDLLAELKQRLNNRSIRITAEVAATDNNKKMLYTAQDKFNHLVEKYPLLNDLKQKLGLDMDF